MFEHINKTVEFSFPQRKITCAKSLQVQLEELFDELNHAGRGKRGPMWRLARCSGRIAKPPRQKQKFVMEIVETVLAQASA